ncbi:MAG TPA: RnfABCDGE type electron transport complex subunit D [Crenotrichaceae bacterium]|nr:RnfABCDGE type electron transport complex subunit D [Crenotrichaceae bacterium]
MHYTSAPYLTQPTNTGHLMLQVLLALIPGTFVMTWIFGYGILINIMLAIISALAIEACVLAIRKKPVLNTLKDNSAIVSAVLLALSIPPLAPWWIIVIGILFAMVVAKHLYGGLGFNIFNPAMTGYAVLMISFPLQMTLWPDLNRPLLSFNDSFSWQFFHQLPATVSLDAITSATPLDALNTAKRVNFSNIGAKDMTLINNYCWWILSSTWLIGGCWLTYTRILAWQLPISFLCSFTMLTGIYWLINPAVHASPLFSLLHGSVIMAAFFILTDPVTAPQMPKGKVISGILVAILVFVIRNWAGYPDGVAFAVLLMNLAVPVIDRYT